MRVTVRTDQRGRVTLPPRVRAAAGIGPHMDVVVEVMDDRTVTVRDARVSRAETVRAARGQFAGAAGGTAQLLANRRWEFEKEEAERRERRGRGS